VTMWRVEQLLQCLCVCVVYAVRHPRRSAVQCVGVGCAALRVVRRAIALACARSNSLTLARKCKQRGVEMAAIWSFCLPLSLASQHNATCNVT